MSSFYLKHKEPEYQYPLPPKDEMRELVLKAAQQLSENLYFSIGLRSSDTLDNVKKRLNHLADQPLLEELLHLQRLECKHDE